MRKLLNPHSLCGKTVGKGNSMEEELIRYIAQSLVENPDEVDVYTREARDLVVIQLQVAPEDTGRVIGRNGRVANAMRSLLRAASRDSDVPVVLEID